MTRISARTKQLYMVAGLCIAVGAIVLVVGYAGIRQEADVALQLPYVLSGGIGGLFLLGAGVGLFLAATLGEMHAGQDRVEAVVAELTSEVRTLLDSAEIEFIAEEEAVGAPRGRSAR
jgi:ribose/xylose/arabinose/galactoside ABC-type transport system permease subunit